MQNEQQQGQSEESFEAKVVFLLYHQDTDDLVPKALNFSFTNETTREEVLEFVSFIAPKIAKLQQQQEHGGEGEGGGGSGYALEAHVSELDLFCVHEGTAYYIRPGTNLLQSKYVRAAVANQSTSSSASSVCSLMLTRSKETPPSPSTLQRNQTMSLMRQPIASPRTVINRVRESTSVPATEDLPPLNKKDVKSAEKCIRDGIYLLHDARIGCDAPHWSTAVTRLHTNDSWVNAATEECSANERWMRSLEAEIEKTRGETANVCSSKERVEAEVTGLRRSLRENTPFVEERDTLEAECRVLKSQLELMHTNDNLFAPDETSKSKKQQEQQQQQKGTHIVYTTATTSSSAPKYGYDPVVEADAVPQPPPPPSSSSQHLQQQQQVDSQKNVDPRWRFDEVAENDGEAASQQQQQQQQLRPPFQVRETPSLGMSENLAREVSEILGTSPNFSHGDILSTSPAVVGAAAASSGSQQQHVSLSVRLLASDLNQYLSSGVRDQRMRHQLLQRIDQIRRKMEFDEQTR